MGIKKGKDQASLAATLVRNIFFFSYLILLGQIRVGILACEIPSNVGEQ